MHTRLDEPIRGRSFAYTAIECDWPIGLPSAKTERTNQRAMLVFPGFVAVFFFSFSGRTKKINEPMADAASGASFPAKINGLHRQKKNQEDKKETKTSKKRNVVFADIGFSFLSFFFFLVALHVRYRFRSRLPPRHWPAPRSHFRSPIKLSRVLLGFTWFNRVFMRFS